MLILDPSSYCFHQPQLFFYLKFDLVWSHTQFYPCLGKSPPMGVKTSGFNEEQDIYLVSKCLPSSYLLITRENFNLTEEKPALHHFTNLIEFNDPSSYLVITRENFNLTIEKPALHHFTHLIKFNITSLGTNQHHVPPEKMHHKGTVSFLWDSCQKWITWVYSRRSRQTLTDLDWGPFYKNNWPVLF